MASAAASNTANSTSGLGSNSSNNSIVGSEPPSPLAHSHHTNANFQNHIRSPQAQHNTMREKTSLYSGATGSYSAGSSVIANTNYSGWLYIYTIVGF